MLGDISADAAADVQRALELFSRNLRG
jgi:hypothetical protein